MPKLTCEAKKCLFNRNSVCNKGQIAVEGKAARNKQNTCCDSFEKGETNYDFEIARMDESKFSDVWCDALNCKHLSDGKCSANSIKIDGSNACTCNETCCETFCEKS